MKPRRNPLEKEHFLEGVRQRWAAVFTAIGLGIVVASCYNIIDKPEPFLQYFLSVGVTFILGASASDVMKSWKVSSETVNKNETVEENITESHYEKVDIKEEKLLTVK